LRAESRPARLRDHAGAVVLAVLLVAVGCSSTGPKNTDKFTGTWTFSEGMFTAVCPNLGTLPNNLVGQTITLTKGMTADLSSTLHTTYGDCTLELSVDGTEANATPNQSCDLTVMAGGLSVPVKLTVTSWKLTSGTASGVATLTTAATGTANPVGDSCTVTVTGVASKTGGAPDASAG
jgi:hypothetical protein